MKKNKSELVTKDGVREIVTDIVMQASDAILSDMERLLQNYVTKEDIKNLASKDDLKRLDNKIDEVKLGVRFLRDDVRNLQADTPTLAEFNELKKKVN